MKATFVKTYVVVALAAGFLAYLYFVEAKKPVPSDTKPKEKLFSWKRDQVKELTLSPGDAEAIHLVKEGGSWKMTAPLAVPADGSEVDSLLTSLEGVEIDEVVVETAANLADYGLEKPGVSAGVLVEGASEPVKLLLGAKSPDGGSVYAKLPTAARVFTIAGYLEGSFKKKPFDLRDRSVLHVKRDAVKTLEISGPEGSYALAKDDKGEWSFTRPLRTRAGRWSVDGLVGTLENLRMESVAAEEAKDLKAFGLTKPARTVVLGLAEGGSKTLEIGGSAGDKKYHAREASAKLVAVIPGAIWDDLAKGMGELRGKRLTEFASYEVEGIELEIEGAKHAFTRSTTKDKDGIETQKWKRTVPEAKDLETSKVDDALFKLGGLDVQEFVDAPKEPAAYGLDAPFFKGTLKQAGGKPEVTLELGRKDGSVYARRPGDDAVLKLDAAKLDEAVKAFKEL